MTLGEQHVCKQFLYLTTECHFLFKSENVSLSQKYPKKKKSGLSELEMIKNRIKKLEKKNRKLKNISKIKSNLEREVIQLKLEKDALHKENTKLKQEASFGSLLRNINMSIQECTGECD